MSETQIQSPNWRIETWFPNLDSTAIANMKIYHDELQKANRALNLVSAKTLAFADVIHFADSILSARMILADRPGLTEIYDLGSGNGFPGLVMAMMSKVKVIVVFPDSKKGEFIQHVASLCKLSNVEFMNAQIEKIPQNSINVCMARGWTSISKAILVTRQKVKAGGVLYHVKGEGWPAEVAEIPTQLCSSWAPSLVGEYKLPLGPMKFSVVKTDKIA